MSSPISKHFFYKNITRHIFMTACICFLFCYAHSMPSGPEPDNTITDEEQIRIDKLDGVADGRVRLITPEATAYATKVYFVLVDSIERLIENPSFSETRKKAFTQNLRLQLKKVDVQTVYFIKNFETALRFMMGELNAVSQGNLYRYSASNIIQSFSNFDIIKNEPCADSFLIYAAQQRPDLVFLNFGLYSDKPYAQHVVEEAAKIAPVTVKRYFIPRDPINEALKQSSDPVVKVILDIKEQYTRKSNAFTLLDGIVSGAYTMAEADSIGNNPKSFLTAMLHLRVKKNPLAAHSLESDLEIYALKFVRVLNELHNERDEKRFASIEKFSAEELYALIVYSEEEIFTSTFDGLFKRLMVKLGPVSGYEFLKEVGENRFRTFIKMSAGFGKLSAFLQSMEVLHRQLLMIKFASGLEEYNDLSQAVEVADAFGSITDTLVLKILKGSIKYEYIRLNNKHDKRGAAIYGLLSNLFVDKSVLSTDWFSSISKQYAMASFDKISNRKLFTRDNVDRWMIYFYDDEDGEASFSSFIKTFTDSHWAVIDSGTYVLIKSKTGLPVHIYANKSKNEYDGQARLEKIFADNGYEPSVMVHRGHSYYAYKTIEKVRENTQIFVLGSCGGYHSISSIIDRSPEASIISSKQIGTRYVNNPMLKLIAEHIRQGKDIVWQSLWNELEVTVKGNAQAYERFKDYIPPHKNLGAIFIKTYNKMMDQE